MAAPATNSRPNRPSPSTCPTPTAWARRWGAERIRAIRLEKLWHRVFKVGVWAAILGSFYIAALHAKRQAEQPRMNIDYLDRAAHLPVNSMLCKPSLTEPCPRQALICMHKDVLGQPVVTNHC